MRWEVLGTVAAPVPATLPPIPSAILTALSVIFPVSFVPRTRLSIYRLSAAAVCGIVHTISEEGLCTK